MDRRRGVSVGLSVLFVAGRMYGKDAGRDVLEPLLPKTRKAHVRFVHNMIEGGAGDANTSGLGQTLQACGYVDSVPVNIVSVNYDVAEIYANAKLNSLCFRRALIVASRSPLDRGRTLDGVYYACELDQRAVTHELHHAPALSGDARIENPAAV